MQTAVYRERRDTAGFLDSVAMEVKRTGFCSTGLALVVSYLESNGAAKTFSAVKELALSRNMSVVRVEDKLVFRKIMKPMSDGVEIQRASGDAECEICHFAFKYHPEDLEPNQFLVVLCNGRRVKL